jgi:hypothetical protein
LLFIAIIKNTKIPNVEISAQNILSRNIPLNIASDFKIACVNVPLNVNVIEMKGITKRKLTITSESAICKKFLGQIWFYVVSL